MTNKYTSLIFWVLFIVLWSLICIFVGMFMPGLFGNQSNPSPALYTVLGAIITAIVAFGGVQITTENARNLAKEERKHREKLLQQEREEQDKKDAQVHFHNYYIIEGFERGLSELMTLHERFVKEREPGQRHETDFDLPITPFLRIFDLIGCENSANVISYLRALGLGYLWGPTKTDTENKELTKLVIELFRAKEILLKFSCDSNADLEAIRQIPEIREIKVNIDAMEKKVTQNIQSHSKRDSL